MGDYAVEFGQNKFGEIMFYVLIENSAYFICDFRVKNVSLWEDELTGKLGAHLTVTDSNPGDPVFSSGLYLLSATRSS